VVKNINDGKYDVKWSVGGGGIKGVPHKELQLIRKKEVAPEESEESEESDSDAMPTEAERQRLAWQRLEALRAALSADALEDLVKAAEKLAL